MKACLLAYKLRTTAPPKETQCLLTILRPPVPELCSNTRKRCGDPIRAIKTLSGNGEDVVGQGTCLSVSISHKSREREKSVLAVPFPSLQSSAKQGRKGGKKTCTRISSIAPLIFGVNIGVFRAFSLEQGRAACSPSCAVPGPSGCPQQAAPCPPQLEQLAVLCFLDVTSTSPGKIILKEFLCLISRFQTCFFTLLCLEAGPVGTSCSSTVGMHASCVVGVCLPVLPIHLRVKDTWLGGWQLTRWCAPEAGERCCGKVTCQRAHSSRLVAEWALNHQLKDLSAVWDCLLCTAFPWSELFELAV